MRIAFVGSNPSHLGPDSPAKVVFREWIKTFELEVGYSFFNVSNEVTPDNRPLKKSEYELERLRTDLRGIRKVVALGTTASDALDRLGINHFKLPHPSPKNRALNDRAEVESALIRCRQFLHADLEDSGTI